MGNNSIVIFTMLTASQSSMCLQIHFSSLDRDHSVYEESSFVTDSNIPQSKAVRLLFSDCSDILSNTWPSPLKPHESHCSGALQSPDLGYQTHIRTWTFSHLHLQSCHSWPASLSRRWPGWRSAVNYTSLSHTTLGVIKHMVEELGWKLGEKTE